jgi:site-specific DNA-methyltransferase (cytosine-N4-specific)
MASKKTTTNSALRVPYTQQFAPDQTPLKKLMAVVRQHAGNRAQLKRSIAAAFFKGKATPETLAGNTVIALKTYGIVDADGKLEPFGETLTKSNDEVELHRLIAQRILLDLDGIAIVETIREMQSAGQEVKLSTLPGELRKRGFQVTNNSSDLSGVFGWLRAAGVMNLSGYSVNDGKYTEVAGVTPDMTGELKKLSSDQLSFLRSLLALGVPDFTPYNEVCEHAESLYSGQVHFNWKEIDRTILKPLQTAGYIEVRKQAKSGPDSRGGKAHQVKPTKKLIADLGERVLSSLARAAGYADLREIASKSWGDVVADLEQKADQDKRAKALELLAIKICQTLDLEFMGWRERDEEMTAGGEVDAMLHSKRLIYSRWQVQCKASPTISFEAIAKEVGAAQVTLATVILVASTGTASKQAAAYRQKIIRSKNLHIIFIEGHHLKRIVENPVEIVRILNDQAAEALRIKGTPSGVEVKEPTSSDDKGGSGGGGDDGGGAPPTPPKSTPPKGSGGTPPKLFAPAFTTAHGEMYEGDSLEVMRGLIAAGRRVKLIMTSPPFALLRQKAYGNEEADHYINWFMEFAELYKKVLEPDGSLVIDIGGTWLRGLPVRSTYHFELLLRLCKSGFYLAQDFYHYNPARLPTPAEWVTVRRLRVKDAINAVWWMVRDPFVPADNRKVLREYSASMRDLIRNGYNAKLRPSGHDISTKFQKDNGGAIPPNLLEFANTESNSHYLSECRRLNIAPHPARFPRALPEFFIKFLTEPSDLVLDPFAGSAVTGEAAEAHGRKWIGIEINPEYVKGARVRFNREPAKNLVTFPAAAEL